MLGCCLALAVAVPSTSQNEIEIQNLRSLFKDATKEDEEEPDVGIQDDVEDGGLNLEAALAKLQDIDEDKVAQQGTAKAQVTWAQLFKMARAFALYEYNMLHTIRRYVRAHSSYMYNHVRYYRRFGK